MDACDAVLLATLATALVSTLATAHAAATPHDGAADADLDRLSAVEVAILSGKTPERCADCLAADMGRAGGPEFAAHAFGELAWRTRRLVHHGLLRTPGARLEAAAALYGPAAAACLLAAWVAAMLPDYAVGCAAAAIAPAAAAALAATNGPSTRTTAAGAALLRAYREHPWNPLDPREAPIAKALEAARPRRAGIRRRFAAARRAAVEAFADAGPPHGPAEARRDTAGRPDGAGSAA